MFESVRSSLVQEVPPISEPQSSESEFLAEAYLLFQAITHFTVEVQYESPLLQQTGPMKGIGKVLVQTENSATVIFEEQGKWDLSSVLFSNKYQWVFDCRERVIRLSHLRFGLSHPEQLGEFKLTSQGQFKLQCPYLCEKDTYESILNVDLKSRMIHLKWKVTKPKNSYHLTTVYRI